MLDTSLRFGRRTMQRLAQFRVPALAAMLCLPVTTHAAVPVVFGTSWDGPNATMQSIADAQYGVGRIRISTTYIGAALPDPDPFFWVDGGFSALLVREIAGNANRNVLGWYLEPDAGQAPVIDGVDDGVIFDGPSGAGASVIITFDRPGRRFGFYLNPNGSGNATNAPEPEVFFTNRLLNDRGLDGSGALHVPLDGDVQALIYDISTITQPNTWLVCFEDLDSGANPGPCCGTTDNDFNDFVFEVQAIGVTPVQPLTFGALKLRYR
jgi:hypothetical protein